MAKGKKVKQDDGEWLSRDELKAMSEDAKLKKKAMAILINNAWCRKKGGMRMAAHMGKSPQLLCNYRSGYKPLTTNMAARIVAAFEELTAPIETTNEEHD